MQGNESEALSDATTSEAFAMATTTETLATEPAGTAVSAGETATTLAVGKDENGSAVDDASTNKSAGTLPEAPQDSKDGSDKDKDRQWRRSHVNERLFT